MTGAGRISARWLRAAPAQRVCAMLEEAGHCALFVGGCVRNALIGAPVSDLDLATDATPERVIALAQAAGLRAIPTGIDHGTVTVLAAGEPVEITTFRRDVETDGRHATVAFSNDVAEDAARRDFTMNALYADARGQVHDPLGGLPDLLARRVRFVGDPAARVAEDYLRILRFFRFTAWYGDPARGMDAEGLAACAAGAEGLACISAERIGAELRKLLSAPDPAPAVAAMAQAGVLRVILPGADPRALAPLVHLEAEHHLPADPIARLAGLAGDDAAQRLRLSRAEAKRLTALRDAATGTHGPAALGHLLGAEDAGHALTLRGALLEQPVAPFAADVARGAAAEFPITAADLPETGRALGARLKTLRAAWLRADLHPNRAALLALPPEGDAD